MEMLNKLIVNTEQSGAEASPPNAGTSQFAQKFRQQYDAGASLTLHGIDVLPRSMRWRMRTVGIQVGRSGGEGPSPLESIVA